MDSILTVERHDCRELARVTLTDKAAAALRAWKKRTWTEFRGCGYGQTACATGEIAELLAQVCSRVAELAQAEGWDNGVGRAGNYHAVIKSASGDVIHATLVANAGDGYYLAG